MPLNPQDSLHAYQLSKRGNSLRVMVEAVRLGRRGARVNTISPGIAITLLANDEPKGPRGAGYRRMMQVSTAGRGGTPDARLGGDEFAMLLDEVDSPEDATMIADRILAGMPTQFGPAGHRVPVGISVGIGVADVRHQTAEALLNDADEALYHAKRNGKGRFSLHPAGAVARRGGAA